MKATAQAVILQESRGFVAVVGIFYPTYTYSFELPPTCTREAAVRHVTPAGHWLVERELFEGYINKSLAGNLKMQFNELARVA